MKIALTILALICCINTVFAQKKQNIYFFTQDEREVTQRDSADFIRIIEEPDSGSVNFKFYEYYADNKIKKMGEVSSFSPKLVFEGGLVSYYPNGKRQEYSTYEKGRIVGTSSFYYRNGRPEKSIEYNNDEKSSDAPEYRVLSYADSTGTQMVKDGNGYFSSYDSKTKLTQEGNYVNGQRDGIWKGHRDGYTFKEIYNSGKFVSGIATWPDNSKHSYTSLLQFPSFKGGMEGFARHVSKNYKYPLEFRKAGVDGRITVNFTVDVDGSISAIKVIKDLGYGTGEEAVRLLNESPRWIPGMNHGIPIKLSYTLPIMLNLQDDINYEIMRDRKSTPYYEQ